MSDNKIYEGLAPAAKTYCLLIALPSAIGIAMYLSSHGKLYLAGLFFVLITQIVISIVPDTTLQNKNISKALTVCGFLSCIFVAYQLVEDFTLINGPDYLAIPLRTMLLFSILSITLTIYDKERTLTRKLKGLE